MVINEKYKCPCCGYLTLTRSVPGTFEICSICYWEDDNVQFEDPDFSGGANKVSLHEARKNFLRWGAIEKKFVRFVRKPLSEEIPKDNV